MKEQVCLLTDNVVTGWFLVVGGVCLLGLLGSLLCEVYERGFRDGEEAVRSHVHRAGFQVMREQTNKYAAQVAWRVVRRVFGA